MNKFFKQKGAQKVIRDEWKKISKLNTEDVIKDEGNESNKLLNEADKKEVDCYELLQECDHQKEIILRGDLGSLSNFYSWQ